MRDIDSLIQAIDSGKLNTSLLGRGEAWLRNNTNMSDEESRNLATLDSKLSSMRNAILLLNKGVQTEGDAQRAMDEIINNKNDTGLMTATLDGFEVFSTPAPLTFRSTVLTASVANTVPSLWTYSRAENQRSSVGTQPPEQAVQVKSQEEYQALPAGTQYMAH